jgi:type VI protein secretion system component Hcp
MAEGLADIYLKLEGESLQGNKLKGECNDEQHRGEDGWIQIKSFNFGFGFEGEHGHPDQRPGQKIDGKDPAAQLKALQAQNQALQKQVNAQGKDKDKDKKKWGQSGALKFEKISFAKSADCMSDDLVELCHGGQGIDKVILEACRTSGIADDDQGLKIPFLRRAMPMTTKDSRFPFCASRSARSCSEAAR